MISRHFKSIYIYLTKELLFSFLVSFAFFFFVFFINQILLIAEKILAKKVPLFQVLELMVYYLPQIVSIAFPFAALVGALMAVGRLSADNEILALRSSGISLPRIFAPMLIISIIFALVAFVFNDYLLPLGRINSNQFLKKIIKSNPAVEFEPYMAKKIEDKTIITGEVNGIILNDIVIIDKTADQDKRIISAKTAYLTENKAQEGVISLELHDVFSHQTDINKIGEYEYSYASKMIYNILLKDVFSGPDPKPTPQEMPIVDVWKEIKKLQEDFNKKDQGQKQKLINLEYKLNMELKYAADLSLKNRRNRYQERTGNIKAAYDILEKEKTVKVNDRTLRSYLLEFFRKLSHPFACVVFIIFAFPVGMVARRGGKLVGFAIGVVMSGLYWGMLFVSYRMGINPQYSTFLSIWTPNFLVMGAGIIAFIFRIRR